MSENVEQNNVKQCWTMLNYVKQYQTMLNNVEQYSTWGRTLSYTCTYSWKITELKLFWIFNQSTRITWLFRTSSLPGIVRYCLGKVRQLSGNWKIIFPEFWWYKLKLTKIDSLYPPYPSHFLSNLVKLHHFVIT